MIEIKERQRTAAGMPSAFRDLTPFQQNAPAQADETPHAFLRRVTRPWHDAVEAAFERFDLQSLEGLSNFLLRQALALVPIEAALEAGGVTALLTDWPQRRRAGLLHADLAALGMPSPPADDGPVFTGALQMLGALYVLEGSKLGGRVLYRRVMASSEARVRAAASFLAHRHERGWTSFLDLLDASSSDAASREALAAGAQATFAQFHGTATLDVAPRLADAPGLASGTRRAHA